MAYFCMLMPGLIFGNKLVFLNFYAKPLLPLGSSPSEWLATSWGSIPKASAIEKPNLKLVRREYDLRVV
jgi:hypothetical protein